MDAYPFPNEFISPDEKEKPWYGTQYAKALFYTNNRYGFRGRYNNIDFQSLMEFAQGRQSVTNLRKLFGYHTDPNTNYNDGPDSLSYIDIQTLNLAPKYINRAVAKMQRINYDISLESIDLVSLDEKADYSASVQAFYRLKDWVEKIGVPLQAAFPGLDVDALPKYPDELLYDVTVNPKIKKEIAGELALKLVLWINNFMQKMREVDWYLVVYGIAHLHCYHDHNMIPRVDVINPKYWMGSYVENDNFENQEYAAFIECITTNQFIKEASSSYTQSELHEIVQQFGVKNSTANSFLDQRTLAEYDNLVYIPVLRFYFLSEDNKTFITRKNKYGGDAILEKDFDYMPDDEVSHRFGRNGDSKIYKPQYTSVYGGTWIIDSDIVFDYGRKPYPRQELVNATLPIKTFATNFKEGRAVSFAAQMVEPIYMINVAWNKIKETLADGFIGQREVNFSELEAVSLGRGGQAWTPREVYQFFLQKKTLVKRGATNPYGQTNGPAIEYTNTGVTLSDHFNTLTMAINILEQMTGTTVAESVNVPDRLPAAAVKESKFSGDLDMEYLFNGHEYLFQRTAHVMLLLIQETKRQKRAIRGFLPALGKVNTGYYEVEDDVAYCEYGMIFGRQPGPDEWADFYNDVRIALQEGKIGLSDSVFLREIDNLKQARQMLVIREKQYRRLVAEEAQRNSQLQMEANAQSIQLKQEADFAYMQEEMRLKGELLKLQGMIDQNVQAAKSDTVLQVANTTNYMKRQIERQKGNDEIIKQGIRNIGEKAKVTIQAESRAEKAKTE